MTNTPHDALVKDTFSKLEFARAALETALPPELVQHIDFSTLRVEPGTLIDKDFSEHRTDLIYSANVCGHRVYIYVLFEHKSSPERFSAAQLLGYLSEFYSKHRAEHPEAKTLPAVIPIVFHHGSSGWTCPRSLHGLLEPDLQEHPELLRWIPNLEFILDDIGRATDSQLWERPVPVAIRFAFWALRDSRSSQLWDSFGSRLDATLKAPAQSPLESATIVRVLRYILEVRDDASIEVLRNAARRGSPKAEEVVMSIAQRLIEQGKLEGELEGRRKQLRRQMTLRFTKLDLVSEQRLATATLSDLDLWSDSILTASSLDDLFKKRSASAPPSAETPS